MMFAYEDGDRAYLPRSHPGAHHRSPLPEKLWNSKRQMITEVYGFDPDSWEARTTPREEAFWRFESFDDLETWLAEQEAEL
jgi:hypothetical protein